MSPLQILATSLAYVIEADGSASVEEKARLLAVLHKHVTRGEMGHGDMKEMSARAFEQARMMDVDRFLTLVDSKLTTAQKLGILINLLDVMAADGQVADGELRVIQQFERAFCTDRPTMQAVREVLTLKNDGSLFTNHLDPRNESGYALKLMLMK